jgi:hypothetical protein
LNYCEYLDLVVKGQKQHLPPPYKPDKTGNPTDACDTTLKIQSNGPNTMDLGDFPACDTIDTFALYKNFTLFEIVNKLVTKEEPLYFNPPNLASLIANPIPRREAHQIQKEMQQRSTGSILIPSSLSWQELIQPPEDLQEVIDDIGNLHTLTSSTSSQSL